MSNRFGTCWSQISILVPMEGFYVSDWVFGWNGENKGRLYAFFKSGNAEFGNCKNRSKRFFETD